MTATLQPESELTSRRALLAAAVGAVAAAAATAARPFTAQAADGDVVHVGQAHDATSQTSFRTPTLNCLRGDSTSGIGVIGTSTRNTAILGTSEFGTGVHASSDYENALFASSAAASRASALGQHFFDGTGVMGYSGPTHPAVPKPKTGVYGLANHDSSARGVWGHSPVGIGVYGATTTGYAGYFSGKVFSTSFLELGEIATPGAPGANKARLFIRDNGSGKSQLCVRFPTGSVKLLATATA